MTKWDIHKEGWALFVCQKEIRQIRDKADREYRCETIVHWSSFISSFMSWVGVCNGIQIRIRVALFSGRHFYGFQCPCNRFFFDCTTRQYVCEISRVGFMFLDTMLCNRWEMCSITFLIWHHSPSVDAAAETITSLTILTHLSLYKMGTVSQTMFSDSFSWLKSFVFWLKFHRRLFFSVQLTIT